MSAALDARRIGLPSILRKKRIWIALIYVCLLVSSGVYRHFKPPPSLPGDRKTVDVNAVSGEKVLPREIRIAYKEYVPENEPKDELPVILVHGSPGDADTFDSLAATMPTRRLISIDLPGFGYSEHDIPDYSFRAHSVYVSELMDKLKIEKAHLVGFSLGGGVIADLVQEHPEKVASLAFVSAIGVQEYELFGNYAVNHLIHGVQLAFFWGLTELTPHFGIFDGVPMSYARNFYDSDQRPLRHILETVRQPVLIVHGKNDPLVPVEAAREHARIIPQSEYHEMDENHFYVFLRPTMVEPVLIDFWSKVESGKAETRATASPERLKIAAEPFVPRIIRATGATALVLFLLIAMLAFINEDLAFLISGMFAAQGRFGFVFAIAACLFGICASIAFFHLLGRRRGKRIAESRWFGFFCSARQIRAYIARRGTLLSMFARSGQAGFQSPVYFLSGAYGPNLWGSMFLYLMSAAVRSAAFIGLFFFLSEGVFLYGPFGKQQTATTISLLVGLYFFAVIGEQFIASRKIVENPNARD